ncbi:hypothetical protein FRB90_004950 [Tulasnella sp. 427]|nr:hypothetical protein FRB90_004950 [Tulasnella sp. 427]
MSDNEAMPEPKPELEANAPISVKVVASTGEEVFFKIKRSTKLTKLQGAYANKVGKDINSIRFLYDGQRIQEEDTPASLGMDEGDAIDVMVEHAPVYRFALVTSQYLLDIVTVMSIMYQNSSIISYNAVSNHSQVENRMIRVQPTLLELREPPACLRLSSLTPYQSTVLAMATHPSNYIIRELTPLDAPLLRTLRLEALVADPGALGTPVAREEAFPMEVWEERSARTAFAFERPHVENGSSNESMAEGRPVGMVGYYWTEEDGRPIALLVGLWVRRTHRGKGIATKLVEWVIGQVFPQGTEKTGQRLRLQVNEGNRGVILIPSNVRAFKSFLAIRNM